MKNHQVRALLGKIEADCQHSQSYTGIPCFASRVMEAIGEVPREAFVPRDMRPWAYANRPLPIGRGQTISQPFIVALMTHLLHPEPDDVMLEIGAGSGYQAAVLSRLIKKLFTLEIVPELAMQARDKLAQLGYDNVEVQQGDGSRGLPEHAPYNGIIVTAAAEQIPQPLVDQLAPGARLVIPIGSQQMPQNLVLVEKDDQGGIHQRNILPVAFVPFTSTKKGEESGNA